MKKTIFANLIAAATLISFFSFDLPKDWIKLGSKPESYEATTEKGTGPGGKNAVSLQSKDKKIKGFGNIMQEAKADKYVGKRVRMTGFIKTEKVTDWAAMWFRVDAIGGGAVSFDNMQDRSIKGTNDWKKYEIVLDVPERSSILAYGILLSGTGRIWFSDVHFEVVDNSIPVTKPSLPSHFVVPDAPTNLDFSE